MNIQISFKDKILKVAAQLKKAKKDSCFSPVDTPFFDPFETDDNFDRSRFMNPTIEEISNNLGRKMIVNLTLLKPFVDILKYKTSTTGVSICPISSNSKLWCHIYKNQRSASFVIGLAQRVGLLFCVDPTYQFHAKNDRDNHCKRYAYDKNVERELLRLFREHDIGMEKYESLNSSYVLSIVARFAKDPKMIGRKDYGTYQKLMSKFKIRVTSKTRLPLNRDFLILGLCTIYPQYVEMLKTIDEDNKMMDAADWDYALPNFTMNKDRECTQIGLRKTNGLCNLKVHNIPAWETLSEDEKKRTRDYVIKERLGSLNENDVKSSIYRITYLLNHGEWLDRSQDLYPMMAGFEMTPEERSTYKAPLAMKLYFSNSTKEVVARSCYSDSATKEKFKKWNADEALAEARTKMLNVIGPSYRSEIFLHESCIYTQVAHKIRQKGYKLIQIYDGFFTDKPLTENDFDAIVKECALEYYHKWRGCWYPYENHV